MIRPIVAYGTPVLKKKAESVQADTPNLTQLIEDMWE
ncbi:MAG: peptide deformylase, partial [Flavobacteriaceae bacterium]